MQTFKINDIDYDCEFKLTNADGQELEFTKSAIRGMTIVDNVFDPFINGTISIANPYDYIENEYFLRGDGRDTFTIKFKPTEGRGDDEFKHEFIVIGDSDHVNPNVRSENIKTLQLVMSDVLPFTEELPYSKTYSGKVGDILKEIFKELLGEDKVDEENWESGDFEITYHPPLTFRYLDLIHYFMRIFYAKDGEINVKGYITHDMATNKFQLKLLSKIFKDNKKLAKEAFSLGDLTEKISFNNPNNPMGETPTSEYNSQMRNLGYSTPFLGWNNDFYLNHLIFGYDPILGVHNIRKIDIEDIKDKWAQKFVDVFKLKGGKPKPFLVFNQNTTKKYKEYRLPYDIDSNLAIVEAELINSMLYYNLQCSFSNIGDSARNSGTFIDIYKTIEEELKSDAKILGRWFVTEVRHIFFADTYSNQILCCKTYVGPNTKIDDKAK